VQANVSDLGILELLVNGKANRSHAETQRPNAKVEQAATDELERSRHAFDAKQVRCVILAYSGLHGSPDSVQLRRKRGTFRASSSVPKTAR
jgi:hypothetical protein